MAQRLDCSRTGEANMVSPAFPYQKQRRRILGSEVPYVEVGDGDPADVTAIVDAYAAWLKTSSVPKLFLKAEPGGILAGGKVLEHARSLPAQTEVAIKGVHFVQEDSPDEIGKAIAGWMESLG
jgi:pimeloyl-ACP methyl ester carboxylesterase